MAYRERVAVSAPPGPRRGPAAAVALLAGLGVWACHAFFVGTERGQALDEAALAGAEIGPDSLWGVASPVLDVVSVPFVVAVTVAAVALAAVRRRPMLAWQVLIVLAGANLTTQLLKATVFGGPGTDVAGRPYDSFPSGHTTVAAAVAAALILVVPVRARSVAALVGAAYTALTGVSTLVGGWHRPSDVVAAVLVVLAWSCVAMLVGSVAPVATYDADPDPGGRVPGARGSAVAVGLLATGAVVTGVLAGVGLARTAVAAAGDADAQLTAFVGGSAGITAVSLAAVAAVLVLVRVTEPVRVRARVQARV